MIRVTKKESVVWYLEARLVAIPLWKISVETGISESSVRRVLSELIAEGRVVRWTVGNNKGPSSRSVYYALKVQKEF